MKDISSPPAAPTAFQTRLRALIDMIAPERPLRIADVGANPINVPDYRPLHEMGGCEVWGFEPDAHAFAALQEQALPGSHFVQRAVGKPGKAMFYAHRQSGLGSLLKIDADAVGYFGKAGWKNGQKQGVEVDLVSLDALDDDELPKPDVLKMDIQGGEMDVFQHGRAKLDEAVCVITEVRFARIYENEPMFGDIDVELRDQGFAFHKFMFTKSMAVGNSLQSQMNKPRLRNQMLDGDAVYVRDPLTIDDWSDEQVKHLALAAFGVMGSPDMTLFCLDNLVSRGLMPETAPTEFYNTLPKWMRAS